MIATVLGVLLADARKHRLLTAVTVLGVAIGVAVVVGIRLSSEAALRAFRATHESVVGRATHEVTGVGPLDAARLAALDAAEAVEHAQPVIEIALPVIGDDDEALGTLRVLGIDPFLSGPFLPWDRITAPAFDDDSVTDDAAAGALFERLMLEPGLALVPTSTHARWARTDGTLRVVTPDGPRAIPCEPVAGVPDSAIAITDLASAQELLGLGARVLRFDLVLRRDDRGVITDATEAAVPLAPGERLDRAGRRGQRADTITRAFRGNLLALGFLAVLVGAFLVFNMAQFAVTRRRPLIGRLRCLGASARAVRRAALVEAAVLGAFGGVLGVAGGRGLAALMVDDVALTVSTLYGRISTPAPTLDALTAFGGVAIAVVAALGASWAPARSAARTPPVLVATGTLREPTVPWTVPLILIAASGVVLVPEFGGVWLPAIAVLLLLLGVATLLPQVLGRLVAAPVPTVVLSLAAGRIQRSIARTGSAAGALVMPLAMTIAISVMVGSFQREVARWVDATMGADVYAKPLWAELAPRSARFPDGIVASLSAHEDVAAIDTLRTHEQPWGEATFGVAGSRLRSVRDRGRLRILEGDAEAVDAALEAGALLITEPLATKTGLGPGDELELDTPAGPTRREIAAVYQDFSYDRGFALMLEPTYVELFGDTGVRGVALLLHEGADASALADELQTRFPTVDFAPVAELRESVMIAFDNTFAITYVLQAISTALAWVGVLTGLLCLHLERRHELGVLRALGSTTRRVGGLLVSEALIIVGVASVASIPTGAALSWILVEIVNKRSFGWTFPLAFDTTQIGAVLALSLVAGLLAGVVPWLLVRRSRIARLLEVTT